MFDLLVLWPIRKAILCNSNFSTCRPMDELNDDDDDDA